MLQAARRVPGLLRTWAGLGASPVRQFAGAAPQQPKEEDPLDDFQLLPPGCSLKDPTYGRSFGADRNRRAPTRVGVGRRRRRVIPAAARAPPPAPALPLTVAAPLHAPLPGRSMSDPVVNYDARPVEEYRPLKKKQAVPAAPLNVAVRWPHCGCLLPGWPAGWLGQRSALCSSRRAAAAAAPAATQSSRRHTVPAALAACRRPPTDSSAISPIAPRSPQAAQAALDEKKVAAEAARKEEDEEELYVYVPPGACVGPARAGRRRREGGCAASRRRRARRRQWRCLLPLPLPFALPAPAAAQCIPSVRPCNASTRCRARSARPHPAAPPAAPPAGSSMRDPLPSSLSDPLDNRRVYYRDPPKRK